MSNRENLVLFSASLLSAGTPFIVVPILLSFILDYNRSNKILLFLFFLFFNISVGNFVYISFILLFIFSVTKTTKMNFVLFTLLSVLTLLLPFELITWQLTLFAIGIILLMFIFLPGVIGRFFMPVEAERKSVADRKRELYRRLAGWK